jgi:hypothetical protein
MSHYGEAGGAHNVSKQHLDEIVDAVRDELDGEEDR